MGGSWPYSYCFVECWFQYFFITVRSVLVQLLASFFFIRFVSVHLVYPYSSMDTTGAWKTLFFVLSNRSDIHKSDSLSIHVYTFGSRVLILFSVNEMLLPGYVYLSTRFRDPPFSVKTSPFFILIKTHVSRFICIDMEAYATCCLLQIMQQRFGQGGSICQIQIVMSYWWCHQLRPPP